jgi:hypothetical protein
LSAKGNVQGPFNFGWRPELGQKTKTLVGPNVDMDVLPAVDRHQSGGARSDNQYFPLVHGILLGGP